MPQDERKPVFWNEQLVGYVEDLSVDNFHLYGKWTPAKSKEGEAFLEMLRADEYNIDIWVGFGENKPMYNLASLPDRNIDVRMLPNPPAKW